MKEVSVKKKKKLYEGKTKIIYETDSEEHLIQEFKDDAVASGGKKSKIKAKGSINNQISEHIFNYLESYHVPTHFVKSLSETSMVVKKLDMLPIEIVMRNIATGNLVKKYKVDEGEAFDAPILEFYLKEDADHDKMVDEDRIISFRHADENEIQQIKLLTQKINAVLKAFFERRDLVLVDFKVEFGRGKSGKLHLGDEISPDTCRLWNRENGDTEELAQNAEAYEEVRNRIFNASAAVA